MSDWKPEAGEVAIIKSTKEPVFVLNVENEKAAIRRPVQGQNGITHKQEVFWVTELQTIKQRVIEELEEQTFMLDQRRKYDRASNEKAKVGEAVN